MERARRATSTARRRRSRSIPRKAGTIAIALDQAIPPIPTAEGHEVRQARAHPERAADEVLGPADAPRRARAAAGGLRHASRRALSARHQPRPLSRRPSADFREEPPDPNLKPDYSRRASTSPGYNRIAAGARVTSSTRTGPARTSRARIVIEIQHANPFYDDSLRGELARTSARTATRSSYELHPVPREEVPRPRRRAGRASCTAAPPAAGRRWRAQVFYPDEYNGGWIALPRPDRLPRLHGRRHLQGQERVLARRHRGSGRRGPAHRNYLGHVDATVEETEPPRAGARHEEPLGRAVGHLGGGVFAGRRRRLSRSASGTSAPASSTSRSPSTGARTTTFAHPAARLGQGARQEARGQAPHLRRRHGQLLPEQRGLSRRGVPESTDEPALRRRGATTATGAEHCWNGDHTRPNALSRLRYHQMFIPKIVERMLKTAPAGADLKSWRY